MNAGLHVEAWVVSVQTVWADSITYDVKLTGPGESPPNASPGPGFAVITIDRTRNTLNIVSDTFSGLLGTTTASHIHCCTAGPGVGTAGVATHRAASLE
jgi:hypothetical protein